ncbi:hypothetical protein ACQPZ8_29515 [Actinomadura nitritigenes]|uniref:hypothetical protein n=1 Tax=Actinomadura nitritigenes TaxID=134602 RepID=UPI003D8A252A
MTLILNPNLGPGELSAYLRLEGWRPSESGPLAQLWSHGDLPEEGLLVPLRKTSSDYQRRLALLLRDLSRIEHRPAEQVQDSITLVFYDVTRVRAAHPELIDDTIPFDAGLRLFQAAQKIVRAAAAATIRRQGSFGNSWPLRAREHVRNVRLGHTERGSYILPIISRARPAPPVSDDPQIALDIDVEESLFDRRVLSTMSDALATLHEMTVRSARRPSPQDVTDAVHEGVSRELCTAIDTALTQDSVAELDVSFTWSRAARAPRDSADSVVFPQEARENVEYVADRLKKIRVPREHVLFGRITHLHHEADDEASGGEVGMETIIERRRRTIWFELDEATYHEAVRYHGEKRRVVVRGTLDSHPGHKATMSVTAFGPDLSLAAQQPSDDTARR